MLSYLLIPSFSVTTLSCSGSKQVKAPNIHYKIGCASFWDFFIASGPWAFVKINGIIKFVKYLDIFAKNLVVSWKKYRLGYRWIIQQINAPKHTPKSTQN